MGQHTLLNGQVLLIREAVPEDAAAVLEYVNTVSGETDFLGFGGGEFELTEAEEAEVFRRFHDADNQLYLVGLIGETVVAIINFSGGKRKRVRHCGEFGMSVRKAYWGLGIGGAMLDSLVAWADESGVVTKINLRVRADNERAIRLYNRKGFIHEGTLRNDVQIDGAYHHSHIMGLIIGGTEKG
ncbi:MAG: putative acetyltransferase YhhY [Chlorobi bacterium OLB7]|nr:MAG: putative acetyltransferase YhhY [Chlorobi bacterium OLB7]